MSKRLCQCTRVEHDEYVAYVDKGEEILMLRKDQEQCTVLQLGTYDVETTVKAATLVKEVCGIDVNLGCGMGFSVKGGMGQALVEDKEKLESIIKALVPLGRPVSCKIRLQSSHEETIRFIQWLYSLGVCIVTLHGRHHGELYKADCDWEELEKVSKECGHDLVLNGDISFQSDIDKLNSFSDHVKGVMIGRAASVHLGLFSPDGGDYVPNENTTKEMIMEYALNAKRFSIAYGKVKNVILQIIRTQRNFPFGSWRKVNQNNAGSPTWLGRMTKEVASSKQYEQLLELMVVPVTVKVPNLQSDHSEVKLSAPTKANK